MLDCHAFYYNFLCITALTALAESDNNLILNVVLSYFTSKWASWMSWYFEIFEIKHFIHYKSRKNKIEKHKIFPIFVKDTLWIKLQITNSAISTKTFGTNCFWSKSCQIGFFNWWFKNRTKENLVCKSLIAQ